MDVQKVQGLHHVTAIASSAQKNYAFYHGVLGLRLVKKTVNFDDPTSYHLYYGDDSATPSTLITFFTWPELPKKTSGSGEIACVGFAVQASGLDFWKERLTLKRVKYEQIKRENLEVLTFVDYEGMGVELVFVAKTRGLIAKSIDVPSEFAISSIQYVVLNISNLALAAEVLETIGYMHLNSHGAVHKFVRSYDYILVQEIAGEQNAIQGIGSIHHVAFAVKDENDEMIVREKIRDLGLHATAQIDRSYFYSVYFREHNGILFEIATNGPGFSIDEKLNELGSKLCLPPQYEKHRAEIVRLLPPFTQ